MKITFCSIAILFFVLAFPGLGSAEKRETFSYKDKSDNFTVKEDWFGKQGKTRKEMELDKEKKEAEARKADAKRRKELGEKQKAAQAAAQAAINKTTLGKTHLDQEKKGFKSSLHSREGDYIKTPTTTSPPDQK